MEAGAPLLVGGEEAAVAGAEDGFRVGRWRGLFFFFFLRERERKRFEVEVF